MNLFIVSFFLLINGIYGNKINTITNLYYNILDNYSKDIPPTYQDKPVLLKLGLALRAFKNIDQMEGTVSANIWLRYQWFDRRLSWNKELYNSSYISLNTNPEIDNSIWVPDIYLYNTAENPLSQLDYSRAIIKYTGKILWSRPGIIESTCFFDLTHFPFDRQKCNLKFGSWSYDGNHLDLEIYDNGFDISNFNKHEEWGLSNYNVEKNIEYYNCCTEPYPDITFYYTITRYAGYYNLNIILPTFATASLILLTLIVPWNSGERISFAITVMLSIIVFLLILSDNLPRSDQRPLLSRMIVGLTLFSLIGVFFTIIISALTEYNNNYDKDEKSVNNKIIKFLHYLFNCKDNTDNGNQNTISYSRPINNSLNFRNIQRSNSYINSIIDNSNNKSENEKFKQECKYLINYFEQIYTIVFSCAFIIYCIIMFSLVPKY